MYPCVFTWTDVWLHSHLMQPPAPIMSSLTTLGKVSMMVTEHTHKCSKYKCSIKNPYVTASYAIVLLGYRCLIDARITGSDSRFMVRSEENKLQFQLEAFRFQNSESGLVFNIKTYQLNMLFTSYPVVLTLVLICFDRSTLPAT